MLAIGPLIALATIALYGTLLAAIVVFVKAVVRISHAFTGISRSLEEIAGAMRTGTRI